jgi:membrane protease subunit (stomatin/prohibitin family)
MGAQMAVGMSMGNAMGGAFQAQPQFAAQQAPSFPVNTGISVTCGKCNTKQPGGKFCAECGATLAQVKKFCTGCGTETAAGVKFCPNCGMAAGAPGPAGAPAT